MMFWYNMSKHLSEHLSKLPAGQDVMTSCSTSGCDTCFQNETCFTKIVVNHKITDLTFPPFGKFFLKQHLHNCLERGIKPQT